MTDNNSISKDFPELLHYTSVSAFESIYKEQIFHATHYEDLNDSSELNCFKLKVVEFISPIIRKHFSERIRNDIEFAAAVERDGGIDNLVDQEATLFLAKTHYKTFGVGKLEPFVCSFCAHTAQSYEAKHGLLSQWRGYGAGGGVAIVLDTQKIEEMMRIEKCEFAHPINHIGNVIYDNDNAKIQSDFKDVFEHFPKIINMIYTNKQPPFESIFDHFLLGSTLVKHHSFHEENEIRIVVSPRSSKGTVFYNPEHDSKPLKAIRYKQRGNREVRYIELFGKGQLPIKRVIIGPSQFQNLNHQKIKDCVQNMGIDIVKSEIPFLG